MTERDDSVAEALLLYLARPDVLERVGPALSALIGDVSTHAASGAISRDLLLASISRLSDNEIRDLVVVGSGGVTDPQYRSLIACFPPVSSPIAARRQPRTQARSISRPVDIVIVTIRDDEYTAVLDRLPDRDVDARARRTYWTAKVPNRHGVAYEVAVVRTTEKGQSAAQETTHDAIEDLDPSWILLVGIAGGSPDPGFTLGDVVVATRLHAFIVGTKLEGRELQLDDQGEPMAPVIEDFVGFLPSLRDDMAGWETRAAIKARRPFVDLQSSHFYGPTEWQERTRLALERNKDRRKPIFTTGPVASGDLLVKDTQLLAGWQSSAHDVAAVEMELAGVCRAARRRDRQYPVLAIRGISDIVGFKRTPDWTTYACHTAASFALRLLAMMPVDFLAPKSFPPVHKR